MSKAIEALHEQEAESTLTYGAKLVCFTNNTCWVKGYG